MNDQITILLKKLITLTKNDSIKWERYSQSQFNLNLNLNSFISNLEDNFPNSFAINSDSYIAHYKNGFIALMAYSVLGTNGYIDLLLQSDKNSKAQCLASSNDDTLENRTLIKRLYNLVDCVVTSPNLNNFINDIIND
jgi:hypothetical protein|nr:MAG TPA: hypothetical protein [Caudoviricetes sp.]